MASVGESEDNGTKADALEKQAEAVHDVKSPMLDPPKTSPPIVAVTSVPPMDETENVPPSDAA